MKFCNKYYLLFFFILCFTLLTCHQNKSLVLVTDFKKNTPPDNALSDEKVALGKQLFFDKRLSLTEEISCASCHLPEKAFTDGKKTSTGIYGRVTERNAPSILNSVYLPKVMFDGELATLEMQVIVPIQEHSEMGMKMKDLIDRLKRIPEYQEAARSIFNRDFDPWVLTRSISAYERTLVSLDSPFDQYYYQKEKRALSKEARAGWKLFSEKLYCTSCHPPPFFTTFRVESNGLVSENDKDKGRFRIHGDSTDIGKFKTPSLRNISLTGPYMHDGRFENLTEVIEHYENGGKSTINQNPVIRRFQLSEKEKMQLLSFFESLSERDLTKYK